MGYPKRERSVEELLSRRMMNLLEVDFPTRNTFALLPDV